MSFDSITRLTAAARTGGICANPSCCCYLLGPSDEGPYAVDVFEAAHIISEAPNGPRYRRLPRRQYDDITNCIPLCRTCHRLIDHHRNWRMYPEELLQQWIVQAEEMARIRRNKPINAPFFDPDKERSTKDKFSENLGEILDTLSVDALIRQGIIAKNLQRKVQSGSRGFCMEWSQNSRNRSHSSRIAYFQDDLVNTMERFSELLRKRQWASYSWLDNIELLSFLPRNTQRMSHDDRLYVERLEEVWETLKRQCYQFINMPY